jgi:hypothetical protein
MKKHRIKFLNSCDFDLINDVVESQMIPRKMKFKDFTRAYQAKHKERHNRYSEV